MIALGVVTSVIVLSVVLLPFALGSGGPLALASSETSLDTLVKTKEAILKRYLIDEKSFADKEISARAWGLRQKFLVHRYIDAARRYDYICHLREEDS